MKVIMAVKDKSSNSAVLANLRLRDNILLTETMMMSLNSLKTSKSRVNYGKLGTKRLDRLAQMDTFQLSKETCRVRSLLFPLKPLM